MGRQKKGSGERNGSAANLGFEAKLWLVADRLRNNMDAAESKHVVLGLIYLKYISDTFAALRDTLLPKPLSGELRAKDAEPLVERVA